MPTAETLQEQLRPIAQDGALHMGVIACVAADIEFPQSNITETRRLDMVLAIVSGEESDEVKIMGLRHIIGADFEVLP
jgi:hypothetical protein